MLELSSCFPYSFSVGLRLQIVVFLSVGQNYWCVFVLLQLQKYGKTWMISTQDECKAVTAFELGGVETQFRLMFFLLLSSRQQEFFVEKLQAYNFSMLTRQHSRWMVHCSLCAAWCFFWTLIFKKSPTGPTERTPQPEYPIALTSNLLI